MLKPTSRFLLDWCRRHLLRAEPQIYCDTCRKPLGTIKEHRQILGAPYDDPNVPVGLVRCRDCLRAYGFPGVGGAPWREDEDTCKNS
jgi:hypothetical protein